MCDYSLHAGRGHVPLRSRKSWSRPTFSTGDGTAFASPDDPKVAVCLRPGTEIAFENDVSN